MRNKLLFLILVLVCSSFVSAKLFEEIPYPELKGDDLNYATDTAKKFVKIMNVMQKSNEEPFWDYFHSGEYKLTIALSKKTSPRCSFSGNLKTKKQELEDLKEYEFIKKIEGRDCQIIGEKVENIEEFDPEKGFMINDYFRGDIPSGEELYLSKGCLLYKDTIDYEDSSYGGFAYDVGFRGDCKITIKHEGKLYSIENIEPNKVKSSKELFDLDLKEDNNNKLSSHIFFDYKFDRDNNKFKILKTKLEISEGGIKGPVLINEEILYDLKEGTVISYPIEGSVKIDLPDGEEVSFTKEINGKKYKISGDAKLNGDTIITGTKVVIEDENGKIYVLKPIEGRTSASLSVTKEGDMLLGTGSLLSHKDFTFVADKEAFLIQDSCISKPKGKYAGKNAIQYCSSDGSVYITGKGGGASIYNKEKDCSVLNYVQGGSVVKKGDKITVNGDGYYGSGEGILSGKDLVNKDGKIHQQFSDIYGTTGGMAKSCGNSWNYEPSAIQSKEMPKGGICLTRMGNRALESPISSFFDRIFKVFGMSIVDITGLVTEGDITKSFLLNKEIFTDCSDIYNYLDENSLYDLIDYRRNEYSRGLFEEGYCILGTSLVCHGWNVWDEPFVNTQMCGKAKPECDGVTITPKPPKKEDESKNENCQNTFKECEMGYPIHIVDCLNCGGDSNELKRFKNMLKATLPIPIGSEFTCEFKDQGKTCKCITTGGSGGNLCSCISCT